MKEVMIAFAVLWGQEMCPCTSRTEKELETMKKYDSIDLMALLTDWANEFAASEDLDMVLFFEEKLNELLSKKEAA